TGRFWNPFDAGNGSGAADATGLSGRAFTISEESSTAGQIGATSTAGAALAWVSGWTTTAGAASALVSGWTSTAGAASAWANVATRFAALWGVSIATATRRECNS